MLICNVRSEQMRTFECNVRFAPDSPNSNEKQRRIFHKNVDKKSLENFESFGSG